MSRVIFVSYVSYSRCCFDEYFLLMISGRFNVWIIVVASPEPLIGVCLDSRSVRGKVSWFSPRPRFGYVDSFWLTALPPFRRAEALRLLVGVPLPERENSVKSWRDGSLYIATVERQGKVEIRPTYINM
ncbi:hypothetical protein ILYODFUR_025743 [Ilyodon furcidens]|uniref:Uncharacterized protein n=1 Tax=Ilyodon furcidens TaxID=33524 RepID=A0ABV0TB25_9TELE